MIIYILISFLWSKAMQVAILRVLHIAYRAHHADSTQKLNILVLCVGSDRMGTDIEKRFRLLSMIINTVITLRKDGVMKYCKFA